MMICLAQERDAERYPVQTSCQVVLADDFRLVAEHVWDLSIDGMLVDAESGLGTVGAAVFFSLRLPGTRLWIDGEGELTRFVRGQRLFDPGPAFGVRFRGMDAMYAALLAGVLAGRAKLLPARARRRDYAETVRRIASAA